MHYDQETDQILPLAELSVGQKYTLIVTGTDQNCSLEFRHGSDGDWHSYPGWSGAHSGGVIVEEFRCISGYMRLNFDAVPGGPYNVSNTAHVQSEI